MLYEPAPNSVKACVFPRKKCALKQSMRWPFLLTTWFLVSYAVMIPPFSSVLLKQLVSDGFLAHFTVGWMSRLIHTFCRVSLSGLLSSVSFLVLYYYIFSCLQLMSQKSFAVFFPPLPGLTLLQFFSNVYESLFKMSINLFPFPCQGQYGIIHLF